MIRGVHASTNLGQRNMGRVICMWSWEDIYWLSMQAALSILALHLTLVPSIDRWRLLNVIKIGFFKAHSSREPGSDLRILIGDLSETPTFPMASDLLKAILFN